jgi:hypothetical protein
LPKVRFYQLAGMSKELRTGQKSGTESSVQAELLDSSDNGLGA